MPTYTYKCRKCGDVADTVQRITEAPLETCEKCGGQVKRVIHPVGIIFKGSGFYTTDYARKKTVTAPSDAKNSADKSDQPAKAEKPESKDKKPEPAGASGKSSRDA